MQELLSVLLALVGVILLLIGVMFLMKWLTGRVSFKGNQGLKVISTMSLGQDKMIVAVRAGSRNLLLGAAAGGINLICELSGEDMDLLEGRIADSDNRSFSEVLRQNMEKVGGEFFRPYPKEKDGSPDKSEDRDE